MGHRPIIAVLIPAFPCALLAACRGTEPRPTRPITPDQAVAVVMSLDSLLRTHGVTKVYRSPDSTVVHCPDGGRARVIGELLVAGRASVTLDHTTSAHWCSVAGHAVTGTLHSFVALAPGPGVGEVVGEGDMTGRFVWAREEEGTTGDCTVGLSVSGAVYDGRLCGYSVTFPVTWHVSFSGS
ncbi:MAG: hypothetical protein OXU64_05350 [Gemmatimonadota bacterium]|nr:hypothetical protein [Gemmatimonadota bacterium]